MKNYVSKGDYLVVPASAVMAGMQIEAGQGYPFGANRDPAAALFGVAANSVSEADSAAGAEVSLAVTGIYQLPLGSGNWFYGDLVHYEIMEAKYSATASDEGLSVKVGHVIGLADSSGFVPVRLLG